MRQRNSCYTSARSAAQRVKRGVLMDDKGRQHLLSLRANHVRRLHRLEEQAARTGANTPPEVLNEIEDVRAGITDLDAQLGSTGSEDSESRRAAISEPRAEAAAGAFPASPERSRPRLTGRGLVLMLLGVAALASVIFVAAQLLLRPRLSCGEQLADIVGYERRAREHRDNGDYACAEQDFQAALFVAASDAERARLYYGLASIALAQDGVEQAQIAQDRSADGLLLDSGNPLLYLSSGLALCRLEDASEAAQRLREFDKIGADSGVPLAEVRTLADELENGRGSPDNCQVLALNLP
jgi:tetratricopeptide (TPR) repeat protein